MRLPPLNAVKVFEVAARTGSFVLAASELGVSSAAVSQQVRNLEIYLGKHLFKRNGNRLALTDAGHAIYPQTLRALGEIADMARRILADEIRMKLVVSLPVSLAELWFAPKLVKLLEFFPHIAFDIRVEDDPVDLARQNIDLRISYGKYHYPALTVIPLMHDAVLPMCAPAFWQTHGNDAFDLAKVHESQFIHTSWGPDYASHPSWADWFSRTGSTRQIDPSQGRRVGLSSLAVSSARLGLGVALGQRTVALADLEAGRLMPLSPDSIPLGHPYCAFIPSAKYEREDIKRLVALLSDSSGLSPATPPSPR